MFESFIALAQIPSLFFLCCYKYNLSGESLVGIVVGSLDI